MGNTLRSLLVVALVLAVTPFASAQRYAAQNAAELSTVANNQTSEFVPLPAATPENTECYNNGPLANSIGTGPGGGDQSILVGDETTFGYGAQGGATDNEVADDFLAASGCTNLKGAVLYTYQTGATSPSITGASVNVYGSDTSGMPDPNNVVCSTTTLAGPVTFTNTYRITAAFPDTQRRLQRVEVDFQSGCNLQAGQRYWIGAQFTGTLTSGPWYPPVPRPLGSTGCPSINGMGAKQSITGGAFTALVNGACPVDLPFSLLSAATTTCNLSFNGTVTATYDPTTRRITFSGRAVNAGPATQVRLEIDYARSGGGPSGTLVFGPSTLPQTGATGVPFSVQQPVPATAPAGTYNLQYELIDASTGQVCATQTGTVVISAPRGVEDAGVAFEAVGAPIAFGSASATAATAAVVASPNPFASRTSLSFTVAEASEVRLAVYDVLGREVATLVNGRMDAGAHTAVFEAGALATGTYVYRLSVNDRVETGRITVVR